MADSPVKRDYTSARRLPTLDSPGTALVERTEYGPVGHHSVAYDGSTHVTACNQRFDEWERVDTPVVAAFAMYDPERTCYQCHESVAELAQQIVGDHHTTQLP